MIYDPHSTIVVTITFTVAGVLTDPSSFNFLLRNPLGVETSTPSTAPSVARVSAGVWQASIAPAPIHLDGNYFHRTDSFGAAAGGAEGTFRVAKSHFVSP